MLETGKELTPRLDSESRLTHTHTHHYLSPSLVSHHCPPGPPGNEISIKLIPRKTSFRPLAVLSADKQTPRWMGAGDTWEERSVARGKGTGPTNALGTPGPQVCRVSPCHSVSSLTEVRRHQLTPGASPSLSGLAQKRVDLRLPDRLTIKMKSALRSDEGQPPGHAPLLCSVNPFPLEDKWQH